MNQPVYVVGSGLFGAVVAERIANDLGRSVTVIEKRDHTGGNCHSLRDPATGIEVHAYGSHIFHTSDERVWRYIRSFCDFNDYRHHVIARVGDRIYPMPISLATINAFFERAFSPAEAEAFLRREQGDSGEAANLEERAVALIGEKLYRAFIRGYTAKQWGCSPRTLPAGIITRLPIRFNYDTRYFSDRYEGIPLEGYGALFDRLLSGPRIEVRLNTDFETVRRELPSGAAIVYTGGIDDYFQHSLGRLGYRHVRFEAEYPQVADFQGNSVINYPDEAVPFTRIHEFRHYHPERKYGDRTVIFKEFSVAPEPGSIAAYPINTPENQYLHKVYRELAHHEARNTIFGGRLGAYRYWDMDDTVAAALDCYENEVKKMLCSHA